MAKNTNNQHSTSTMTGPVLRVQRANRFVWDEKGYWQCTIVGIELQEAPDHTRAPRYRWSVEGEGSIRPWRLHFSTPSELLSIATLDEQIVTYETTSITDEEGALENATPSTNLLVKIC